MKTEKAKRFCPSQARSEAKRSELDDRHISRKLRGSSKNLSVYFTNVRSIPHGKSTRRVVDVYLKGARTDFYDPVSALLKDIEQSVMEESQISEIRKLDPSQVTAVAPDQIRSRPGTWGASFWRAATRRLGSITDEVYLASWRARHVRGVFFLFRDRLLLLSYRQGWHHEIVPSEGLELSPNRRIP
jgi:hypothetical protein